VFPTRRGALWIKDDWDNWRKRVFKPTAARVGASIHPYDLRHTFASLLIASGATAVETAAQLGHDAVLTLRTCAQLFEEFDPASRPDPVAEIQLARIQAGVRERYAGADEPADCLSGSSSSEPGMGDQIGSAATFTPGDGARGDERIRTADPLITTTPRGSRLIAVRGAEWLEQGGLDRVARSCLAAGAGWCAAIRSPSAAVQRTPRIELQPPVKVGQASGGLTGRGSGAQGATPPLPGQWFEVASGSLRPSHRVLESS